MENIYLFMEKIEKYKEDKKISFTTQEIRELYILYYGRDISLGCCGQPRRVLKDLYSTYVTLLRRGIKRPIPELEQEATQVIKEQEAQKEFEAQEFSEEKSSQDEKSKRNKKPKKEQS